MSTAALVTWGMGKGRHGVRADERVSVYCSSGPVLGNKAFLVKAERDYFRIHDSIKGASTGRSVWRPSNCADKLLASMIMFIRGLLGLCRRRSGMESVSFQPTGHIIDISTVPNRAFKPLTSPFQRNGSWPGGKGLPQNI